MVLSTNFDILVPSSVLAASILGSWHCVGMCGGLITASTHSIKTTISYHLSRLFGYVLLGFLSSILGAFFVLKSNHTLSNAAFILISVYFIFLGISLMFGKSTTLHFKSKYIETILSKLLKNQIKEKSIFYAGCIGFFSVFLPCGWLYLFVLASVQIKNPLIAASTLGLFWLGTLPALLISPLIIQKFLNPIRKYLPRFSGLILILLGIITLLYRYKFLSTSCCA